MRVSYILVEVSLATCITSTPVFNRQTRRAQFVFLFAAVRWPKSRPVVTLQTPATEVRRFRPFLSFFFNSKSLETQAFGVLPVPPYPFPVGSNTTTRQKRATSA